MALPHGSWLWLLTFAQLLHEDCCVLVSGCKMSGCLCLAHSSFVSHSSSLVLLVNPCWLSLLSNFRDMLLVLLALLSKLLESSELTDSCYYCGFHVSGSVVSSVCSPPLHSSWVFCLVLWSSFLPCAWSHSLFSYDWPLFVLAHPPDGLFLGII